MQQLKLFMVMLGCTPPGRHIEQHDIFFGIAADVYDLKPEIYAYWPEPERIHMDAWREVTAVDGYRIRITEKQTNAVASGPRLFFINLGGYTENKFEEQHYIILTVKENRSKAFAEAKQTLFFQHNHFDSASSHIDDKYGIDVDDLYEIEDILLPAQKEKYTIEILTADGELVEDELHLGYFKLN